MNASYANILEYSFFTEACNHFATIVQHLNSTGTQDHSAIEQYLRTEGDEVLRLLLQGFLDKQTSEETQLASVTGPDGNRRNHVRNDTSRSLTTLFGKVTVKRKAYSQQGLSSIFPMDAQLNLNGDQYSDGVRKRIISDASGGSYDQTIKRHRNTCPGTVGKRQAAKLVEDGSQDFVSFYEQRQVNDEQTNDLLALSFDGKGLVMLPEGLREATRKNAEKSQKKRQTRLSPGEKKDRKGSSS